MKLDDWMHKNLKVKRSESEQRHVGVIQKDHPQDTKGLHVIGTCGECEYWGDRDMAWDEDARTYRICEKENEDENIGIFSPTQRRSNAFLKDFGCIHFEAKGEK